MATGSSGVGGIDDVDVDVDDITANDAPPNLEYYPLWEHIHNLGKVGTGAGGNRRMQCKLCDFKFSGSYPRIKGHLLKLHNGVAACERVSAGRLNQFLNLEDEAKRRKANRSRTISLPQSGSSSSYSSSQSVSMDILNQPSNDTRKKRRVVPKSALEKAFNVQVREQLDGEIARMFYSSGLSFNLARNPHFIRAFSFAANNDIAGYIPPSYNSLRTKLLQKERSHLENMLESTKSTWRTKGVSIVCDGWTDPQRRPLINFVAISESGPVFIHAINCEGEFKDKFFIASLIIDVITKVGVGNVVQVITDNAPVCKAAGLLVEQAYPDIFWTPCVVHTLNLALKNICAAKNTSANEITYGECNWVTEIAVVAVMIKNFIMNHSMRLSMFNEYSRLKLVAVAETRFASTIVMLKRFKLIKQQLQNLVISDKWSLYRDDDVAKARRVRDILLDDDWWEKIDYILEFTDPIYSMLRLCDTDKPCLHLVYEMWDTMIMQVKKRIYRAENKSDEEESTFWNVVKTILEDRWTKSNNPLHCLAYSLNPRSMTKEWEIEHPHLAPPNRDAEVSDMRKKCLKRLFPNNETRAEVNRELARFFGCSEGFSDEDSIRDRWGMNPTEWWIIHGSAAPLLQPVAIKILGQVSSSSCSERNWSTYAFIHSTKRNRITPQRAEDLVFVHSNLRLLSRKSVQYTQGESRMWDVAGDAFESMDDVGTHEIANLSLDEPDFESVLFVDDVI